tara:strand:+ start:358 stop:555 length:198 start_codon:yes stop_codon:yes gene_type:complete
MSLKSPNSKRITFGLFQSEKKALDQIEHYKKFRMKKGVDPKFFVVKRKRNKDDKKSYEAYCLVPR